MTQKYQIQTRVFTGQFSKLNGYPVYRSSYEYFTDAIKARKKYDRMVELHSPEMEINLGNVTSGLFNMIIKSNYGEHALWLCDTHGYKMSGWNYDALRKGLAN